MQKRTTKHREEAVQYKVDEIICQIYRRESNVTEKGMQRTQLSWIIVYLVIATNLTRHDPPFYNCVWKAKQKKTETYFIERHSAEHKSNRSGNIKSYMEQLSVAWLKKRENLTILVWRTEFSEKAVGTKMPVACSTKMKSIFKRILRYKLWQHASKYKHE